MIRIGSPVPAIHCFVKGLRYVLTTVGLGATAFAAAVFGLGILLGAFLTYSSGTVQTGSGPGEVSLGMIFGQNIERVPTSFLQVGGG